MAFYVDVELLKCIYMKNVFLAIIVCLLLISCDKSYYDSFIIKNNCDELITLNIIVPRETEKISFTIQSQKDTLFRTMHWVAHPLDIIEITFMEIIVRKDSIFSQKNYIDRTKWTYVDSDATNRIWYLIINPEDFEQ